MHILFILKKTDSNPCNKRHYWRLAGIAACVLVVFLGLLFGPKLLAGMSRQNSQNQAIAILHDYADIYYTEKGSGEIKKESVLLDYTPQAFFAEWKKRNQVPEQVKLLDSNIESNGHEERTSSTVQYFTGNIRVLNLTFSKDFLELENRATLMRTLEKTFQDRYAPYQTINMIVDGKILNH